VAELTSVEALKASNLALHGRRGYVEQRREELRPGVVLVHMAKPLA
jgi:hypothetical protein